MDGRERQDVNERAKLALMVAADELLPSASEVVW